MKKTLVSKLHLSAIVLALTVGAIGFLSQSIAVGHDVYMHRSLTLDFKRAALKVSNGVKFGNLKDDEKKDLVRFLGVGAESAVDEGLLHQKTDQMFWLSWQTGMLPIRSMAICLLWFLPSLLLLIISKWVRWLVSSEEAQNTA